MLGTSAQMCADKAIKSTNQCNYQYSRFKCGDRNSVKMYDILASLIYICVHYFLPNLQVGCILLLGAGPKSLILSLIHLFIYSFISFFTSFYYCGK